MTARTAAYVERKRLQITTDSAAELREALSHVVSPRMRRRLIEQAGSLLAARLRALVHGQAGSVLQ